MFILIGWYNARVKDARRLNPLGSILLYGFLVYSALFTLIVPRMQPSIMHLYQPILLFLLLDFVVKTSVKEENVVISFS